MDPVVLAVLILAAVAIGAVVPVLLQLRATLRSLQVTLDELRPQLQRTLVEVEQTAAKLNRVSTEVEIGVQKTSKLVAGIADLGLSVTGAGRSVQNAMSLGGVVGPALLSAVRAFFRRGDRDAKSNAAGSSDTEEAHAPREEIRT